MLFSVTHIVVGTFFFFSSVVTDDVIHTKFTLHENASPDGGGGKRSPKSNFRRQTRSLYVWLCCDFWQNLWNSQWGRAGEKSQPIRRHTVQTNWVAVSFDLFFFPPIHPQLAHPHWKVTHTHTHACTKTVSFSISGSSSPPDPSSDSGSNYRTPTPNSAFFLSYTLPGLGAASPSIGLSLSLVMFVVGWVRSVGNASRKIRRLLCVDFVSFWLLWEISFTSTSARFSNDCLKFKT